MVLNDDGSPVRWSAALTRNLLRAVDFLPFLYATGLAAMLVNRDFKRLGDLAAGTVVVYREGAHRAALIPAAAPLAPPAPLSLGEQRTLLDLAERAPVLVAGARRGAGRAGAAADRRSARGSRRARAARGQPSGGAAVRQAAFVERYGPEWDAFEAWLKRRDRVAARRRRRTNRRPPSPMPPFRSATGACASISRSPATASTARISWTA